MNFPPSPNPGDNFSGWTWDGVKWVCGESQQQMLGHYLPLTGGTLAGPGNLNVNGLFQTNGAARFAQNALSTSNDNPALAVWHTSASYSVGLWQTSNGDLNFGRANTGGVPQAIYGYFDSSGNYVVNAALQAGGNITSAGSITAANNITATGGNVHAGGNLTANGNVTVNGRVTGNGVTSNADLQVSGIGNFGGRVTAAGVTSNGQAQVNGDIGVTQGGTIGGNLTVAQNIGVRMGGATGIPINAAAALVCGSINNMPTAIFIASGTSGRTRALQCDGRNLFNSYIDFTINSSGYSMGPLQGYIAGMPAQFYSTSDADDKQDVEDIPQDYSARVIDRLRPVRFRWRDAARRHKRADGRPTTRSAAEPQDHGFLAQEVYEVYPEAVMPASEHVDLDGKVRKIPWSIAASTLVPILVAELRQLRRRVADLEGRAPRQRRT